VDLAVLEELMVATMAHVKALDIRIK